MKIRKARLTDVPVIVQIHRSVVRLAHGAHYSRRKIRAWVNNISESNCKKQIIQDRILIAEVKKSLIGFVHFDNNGTIYELYFVRKFWNKGYGSILLDRAETSILRAGAHRVTLNASINSERFYVKKGYRRRKFLQFGPEKISLVLMSKALD